MSINSTDFGFQINFRGKFQNDDSKFLNDDNVKKASKMDAKAFNKRINVCIAALSS